jgi:S1-C subfamily serine protease
VRTHSPGDEVALTVLRDGDEQVLDVTLGELPS